MFDSSTYSARYVTVFCTAPDSHKKKVYDWIIRNLTTYTKKAQFIERIWSMIDSSLNDAKPYLVWSKKNLSDKEWKSLCSWVRQALTSWDINHTKLYEGIIQYEPSFEDLYISKLRTALKRHQDVYVEECFHLASKNKGMKPKLEKVFQEYLASTLESRVTAEDIIPILKIQKKEGFGEIENQSEVIVRKFLNKIDLKTSIDLIKKQFGKYIDCSKAERYLNFAE